MFPHGVQGLGKTDLWPLKEEGTIFHHMTEVTVAVEPQVAGPLVLTGDPLPHSHLQMCFTWSQLENLVETTQLAEDVQNQNLGLKSFCAWDVEEDMLRHASTQKTPGALSLAVARQGM